MHPTRTCGRLLALTVFVGLWATMPTPEARASSIGYTIANTVGTQVFNGNTAGFRFTTNGDIIVSQLGVFDSGQDGLGEDHSVGIWNASGVLLVSASVLSGTVAPLTDQFRYVSVVPTLLIAGQSYDIGVHRGLSIAGPPGVR